MNQLKVQAPYLSKNPMIDHTLTSQSQPSLLSSSDYSKPVDIKQQLARSGINPKDTEQLAFNIINQLQPESPTDNFESLLSLGVSPNLQQSHDGKSFLMIAAERGLHKVFSKLLRLNASVNLRDYQGKTALFYIIESKSPDLQILQDLLQKDVDLNIRSRNGLTPIQTAIERGLINVVDLLAKKRANPFIKFEPSGDTALHVAARRRDKAMFKYLLDYGFDPKRRNKNRQTVKDVCKDQPELLDLLKDKLFSEQDGTSDQRRGPQGAERVMQSDNRKSEVGKSNKYSQNFNRVRDENPESLNNTGPATQEQKNLPLRNDDNYSNASTSYSNGHSEINFHTKHHNPPLTLTSHYSDDPSKYSDKPSGQFSNNLQVHNRQRENSGVSRTSITSAQSDMVSDNESMSAHSQSNLASNSYMQQFSPDMQEKSKNAGSVGEANVGYFNTNGPQNFNRDYSRSQSYMNTSGGESSANGFNKQQKRNNNGKYKTQGSLKTPYSNNNGGNFNDYPSPNFNSNRDPEMSQINQMGQQQYFNNSRSPGQVENSSGKINLISNGNSFMPPGVENRQMMMNENGPGSPNIMYPGSVYQNQGYNNYGEMPGMPGMMNYRGGNQQGSPQFFFNPQHGFLTGPNSYMGMPDFNSMIQVQDHDGGQSQPSNENHLYNKMQQQQQQDHLTNQAQQENVGLRDRLSSTMKQSKEYQVELYSAKQENRQLKNLIEDTNVSSKSLEQILKEKEELIQELIRKNQSLEDSIKQVNPDFIYDGYHSKGCSTDSILTNFMPASMEDILFNEKLYRPFPKPEDVTRMLDQEVREFERAIDRYSETKQPIYDRLQELFHVSLADLLPEAECTIYGSFATGLWLPWSDIDIVIKIPQIENALNVLHLLETRLKEEDWISETKAIKNTTVPLLKIVCSEEFMKQKLDITIKDFRHNELSCVNMIKEYIALYPPLRPITLIIKDFLNSINLNNTYLGGLSSYGILLMVVYLLQTKEMERSKNPKEEQNLGEMLLSFLQCFGLEYDYYTQYVVNPMKILTNGETPNEMMNIKLRNMIAQSQPSVQQPRIVIQDPVSIQNNVGKSTFRIIEIKSALTAAYFEAFKPCTCEIHDFVEGLEGGEKKEHQCSSILRKMYVASQSGQIFQNKQ